MQKLSFQRPFVKELARRLAEPRRHIQLLAGPRQVGKTTGALQALSGFHVEQTHFVSADDVTSPDDVWLRAQWELGRAKATKGSGGGVLVLDEIQKVPKWSTVVKGLWDQDSHHGRKLKVVLLGSSALLLARGLTESLAGRFESLPVSHWTWNDSRQAFGWTLDQHLLFGGYPSPAGLIDEPLRWRQYIREAMVETAISQDVLATAPIEKPALLRRLFTASCDHAAQVVSYTKLLGQMTDQGNTTILSHYQTLLERAWLIAGLQKYTGSAVLRRASSPKWLPLAPALITTVSERPWEDWSKPGEARGQLVEAAVGAHLAQQCRREGWWLGYWREGDDEVDYVVKAPGRLWAVEVKSGRARGLRGMRNFLKKFPKAEPVVVEGSGGSLERFLSGELK